MIVNVINQALAMVSKNWRLDRIWMTKLGKHFNWANSMVSVCVFTVRVIHVTKQTQTYTRSNTPFLFISYIYYLYSVTHRESNYRFFVLPTHKLDLLNKSNENYNAPTYFRWHFDFELFKRNKKQRMNLAFVNYCGPFFMICLFILLFCL